MVQPFIGEIRMFGGNFAPYQWAFCQGSSIAITENEALYALIGDAFGGDGRTYFKLPDFRGRIPVHQGTGLGLTPRARGNMYGTEMVKLTTAQIPTHNHPMQASTQDGQTDSPDDTIPANGTTAGDSLYVPDTEAAGTLQSFYGEAVESAGNDDAHINVMPVTCISFIIALQGLFPARN